MKESEIKKEQSIKYNYFLKHIKVSWFFVSRFFWFYFNPRKYLSYKEKCIAKIQTSKNRYSFCRKSRGISSPHLPFIFTVFNPFYIRRVWFKELFTIASELLVTWLRWDKTRLEKFFLFKTEIGSGESLFPSNRVVDDTKKVQNSNLQLRNKTI